MAVISKMTFDNGSTKNLISSTFYGKCDTAAATAAKTVTIGGWDESVKDNVSGATVHIYFTNGNSASNPTLNIDSQGAHKIITSADTSVGSFSAGVYEFTLVPSNVAGDNTYRWLMQANVDWSNVSNKPSLDFIPTSQKGANSGVATLDANGKVPSSQLPSYVDDVLEYAARSLFPSTGTSGIIYIDTSTNLTYRWSGSNYVEISPSLALGTTHATAAYGDEGATAYAHATDNGRLTTAASSGLYKISVTSEGHVGSATAVTKSDITALGIPAQDTTYTFDGTYDASTNKAATVKTVTDAVNALDGSVSGSAAASKTLKSLSQTNGVVTAEFEDISITKSQISDFPTSMTPTSHTHGYISNDGKVAAATSAAIASGDKLVITTGTNHDTVTSSTLTFGSGTDTFLRNNGTWGSPYIGVTSVTIQGTSPISVDSTAAITGTGTRTISLAAGYGDTQNPYASKTKNYVLAAPSTAAGAPTFRALVADDIPTLTKSKISDFPTSMPASDVSAWAKASTKPSYSLSEISGTDDLQEIEALTGASGLLKKTAANVWTLDTTAYSDVPSTPSTTGTYSLNVTSSGASWTAVAPSGLQPPSGDGHYMLGVSGSSVTWESSPDIYAIEQLSGTSGLLKKTAANTWSLDTTTYLASGDIASWAKAANKPSYSLSEISGTDDIQVIEGLNGTGLLRRVGSNQWETDSTTYLPTTGGQVTGDITLLKQVSSGAPGDSYGLIFQRGTLTDNYNDWMIIDSGGYLYLKERGTGSTAWTTRVIFNTTGNVSATSFTGSGASLTSLNASNLSSGTVPEARLPDLSSTYIPSSQKGAASGVAELDSNSKVPVVQSNYLFGKCTTAGGTAAKTVTIAGYDETTIADMEGVTIHLLFKNANSASSPTLNVSGAGAHPIVYGSSDDPVSVSSFTGGMHTFTLAKDRSGDYYWWLHV